MRRIMAGPIAVLACMVSGGVLAWAPSADVARTLIQGQPWSEVAPADDGAGLIHAAIDIAAPPKTVWAVMTDCKLANRLIVTLTSCKIVQSDPQHGWDIREQVTRGNFFVPTIHNVVHNDYQPYTLIKFRKAGGDLRIEEGEWRLEALAGGAGTRVTYVNLVAANILAPASLVRAAMKRDTAKVLVNLRRECLAAVSRGGA